VDAAGTGMQASARAKILSSAALKASSDDPISGYHRFAYLNTVVKPMNNVHCRMAVEYAANKTSQQTAYGGPVAGGQIASTVAPPNVIGQKHFDYYEATTKPGGDVAKARAQLKLCGRPNGGDTISPAGNINIAELSDPKVNGLLAKMASTNDATTRNSYTAQIDRRVMKDAAILPEVYAKSLLYRSPNLTNVYVQAYYGMYNYAVLGLK